MPVQARGPGDCPRYPLTDEACPGSVGSDAAAHVLSPDLGLNLDLDACLFQLSRLAAERSHAQAVLARITTRAAHAIPGADGAGLTMLRDTRPLTVGASEPFVAKMDDIQYTLREGPCLEAARRGQTARSGSLARMSGGHDSAPVPAASACTVRCPCR